MCTIWDDVHSCADEKHSVLVVCDVQGFRVIYVLKYYITWYLERYGHFDDVILKNRADNVNDKEKLYLCLRSLARFNPPNGQFESYLYSGGGFQSFAVFCGGLPAFHRLSSDILV